MAEHDFGFATAVAAVGADDKDPTANGNLAAEAKDLGRNAGWAGVAASGAACGPSAGSWTNCRPYGRSRLRGQLG